LGIGIQDITPPIENSLGPEYDANGAFVFSVTAGSPAEKAGIKPGDVIAAADGRQIKTAQDLSRLIASIPVGQRLSLSLHRSDKKKTVTAAIADQPPQVPAHQQGRFTAQDDPAAALNQAGEEAKTAVIECRNMRLSGELQTYMASARCSNSQIIAAFQRASYRYMDLIFLMTAKRLELAEKVDSRQLTDAQMQLEYSKFMVRIDDEERQRDKGGAEVTRQDR